MFLSFIFRYRQHNFWYFQTFTIELSEESNTTSVAKLDFVIEKLPVIETLVNQWVSPFLILYPWQLSNGLHQWYLVVRNHSKDVIVTTWQLAWLVATMNDYSTSLPWTKTSFFSLTPRQWPDIAVYKVCVRKLYKLYLDILSKNLYYWVEIVIWHDMIRALMIKQSRIRISLLSFYLIKIKHKIVWIYTSSSSKRFYLRECVRKLYK